jgi:hypothetical protein
MNELQIFRTALSAAKQAADTSILILMIRRKYQLTLNAIYSFNAAFTVCNKTLIQATFRNRINCDAIPRF